MSFDALLMRKNDPLMFLLFSEKGEILQARLINENLRKYLPLSCQNPRGSIKTWWNDRAVPIEQGGIKDFLKKNGFSSPDEYLFKNLGLSLTDCYWIKPLIFDDILSWENINLYQNEFDENRLYEENNHSKAKKYSPNGSLQGQIEKTWIILNGERYMLKGNRTDCSAESINEVIASELHSLQGYDNFTPYKLEKSKGKSYDYVCSCKLFTSENIEFVSAYDIVSFTKKSNDVSYYEHFINNCGLLGMDTELLRKDLEYQIMTDFVLSQYDRHLNNIGILRDADTLVPLRMAPIYDSGACLFVNQDLPRHKKALKNIKTNSFFTKERALVKVVTNYNVVDSDKLPSASYIESMYRKDSKFPKDNLPIITAAYKAKIEMYKMLSQGDDPFC